MRAVLSAVQGHRECIADNIPGPDAGEEKPGTQGEQTEKRQQNSQRCYPPGEEIHSPMIPRSSKGRDRLAESLRIAFHSVNGHAAGQREDAKAKGNRRQTCEDIMADRYLRLPAPECGDAEDRGRSKIGRNRRKRNTATPERIAPWLEAAEIWPVIGAQP